MNRSALAALGLGVLLAAGACGRYGPPVRPFPANTPSAAAGVEGPDPDDETLEGPTGPGDIETFEDGFQR